MHAVVIIALLVLSIGCAKPQEFIPNVTEPVVQPTTPPPNVVQPSTAPPKIEPKTPQLKLLWKYKTGDSVYGAGAANNASAAVFASWDGYVYVLDKIGALLWRRELIGSPQDAAISADGNYTAATGYLFPEGMLYLFKGSEALWQAAIQDLVKGVDISQDGGFIALASGDGKVRLYHRNGSAAWDFQTGKGAWGVWDVAISPDSQYLAAACDDTYLYLLDINGKLLWKNSQGKNSYLYSAALSKNAERVAAASQDGYVYVYGKSGALLWKYRTNVTNYGVALSSDGEYLAIASWDKNLYLLDGSGKLIQNYALDSEANRAAFSQDDRYIVVGAKLGYTYLFELER